MIRRAFVAVCCAFVLSPSLAAQSADAKKDPLTGSWTGQIVLSGGNQVSITLELKFDGKQAVTGTISGLPNPGDVKKGTFDPKTGVLNLQMGRSDASDVLLVFDGKVEKNTASGRVNGEAGAGEFTLTRKG
jgi:hypothetical protein